MNEGDRWDDYTIPVVSRESQVIHRGHRLLVLPAENDWVACSRWGYWHLPSEAQAGKLPICSICRRAIEAAKRRAQ